MCWNVRGLNDGVKRASVRNLIISSGATVVCLQETKIANWNFNLILETVGPDLAQNCVTLPAEGVSGGGGSSWLLLNASSGCNTCRAP